MLLIPLIWLCSLAMFSDVFGVLPMLQSTGLLQLAHSALVTVSLVIMKAGNITRVTLCIMFTFKSIVVAGRKENCS